MQIFIFFSLPVNDFFPINDFSCELLLRNRTLALCVRVCVIETPLFCCSCVTMFDRFTMNTCKHSIKREMRTFPNNPTARSVINSTYTFA